MEVTPEIAEDASAQQKRRYGRMSHHHEPSAIPSSGRLLATMLLNLAITVTELVGGLASGSLSLLSDALHNLSDGIAIAFSYVALRLRQVRKSSRHTFGLKRAEILVAVVNSGVLAAISVFLFVEAGKRLLHPEPVQGFLMIGVALIGLAANVIGTLLLKRDATHSLNIRSAYLHLLSDAASSLAVVLGGAAILLFQLYWVDPVLTILIGLYVLWESLRILSQALHVLMEGAPPDLDLPALGKAVESLPGVRDLHHLHVWTVGEGDIHLEAHVTIDDVSAREADVIRSAIEDLLRHRWAIGHTTLQLECGGCPGVGLVRN